MTDIAKDVKREFGVDVARALEELQKHMVASREIYGAVRTALQALDGYGALLKFETRKPDAQQKFDDFEKVWCISTSYVPISIPYCVLLLPSQRQPHLLAHTNLLTWTVPHMPRA